MGWATRYIDELKVGNAVEFRPRGNSMVPLIQSGDLCAVEPITDDMEIEKDSIVLCRVGRAQYLHLVTAVKNDRYQISNNKGHVNGWIGRSNIYGILRSVSP